MKDNNEPEITTQEESFYRKLAKNAAMKFTSGAAVTAGALLALAALSALVKPQVSQNSDNQESEETKTEEVS